MKLGNENYRLKKMARHISKDDVVLDIGCSQMPNPYIICKRLIGLDIVDSPMPINYEKLVLGNALHLEKHFGDSAFDVIVAGEFIEHLENPIDFLREVSIVLKTNGKIVLSTPNPNSFIERLLTITLNRKIFYTTEHIMLYPQRWLIRILEIANFKRVKLESGGMLFPFFGLLPFPRLWCYQTIAIAENNKN